MCGGCKFTVCMHLGMYLPICKHTHIYKHTYIHMQRDRQKIIYLHIYTIRAHTHTHTKHYHRSTCTNVLKFTRKYIHSYTNTHTHTFIHAYKTVMERSEISRFPELHKAQRLFNGLL